MYASLVALLMFSPSTASAQSTATPGTPPPAPYVLHAYTDLLQVPTLVLNGYGSPLGRLARESFQLQIDSGPTFHPSAVHTEGAEALSLAIVLDASGAQKELIKALSQAPGHGIPVTLLPDDTLSIYAFDCRIFRSAGDASASDPSLAESIDTVLAAPRLHNPGGKTCPEGKHLWEALGVATRDLATQPGRRAIIAISDGQDYGSPTKWENLRQLAADHSIAIFGLRDPSNLRNLSYSIPLAQRARYLSEDLFVELAGRTGGLVFNSDRKTLAGQLEHVIALLRSRYILQFSRPQMPAGEHRLEVHIADSNASVHIAGIGVPVRDAALWDDPTTVPTDTSKLPVAGKRKPLKP